MNTSDTRIREIFSELEEILKELRHSGNVIEVTEAYKKIRELGLWIALAGAIQPIENTTNSTGSPKHNPRFANKNK